MPFNVDREALAWAAGLFEGEGTVAGRAKRHEDRAITISLRMTDQDVVKLFHSVVCVGNFTGPSNPPNPKWKPLWTWQAGKFETVQAVCAMLWPWLCVRRRAQFKRLLTEYHKLKPMGVWGRHPETGRFAIMGYSDGKTHGIGI